MTNFYKGGRGLAFSQGEGGIRIRKEKPPRLSNILTNPVARELSGSPSAAVRQVVDRSPKHPRVLLDTCVEYPCFSTIATQAQPKDDPSASLAQPSRRTDYGQGLPKSDTRNTRETTKNDTKNRQLMYGVWFCFMLFNLSSAWAQSRENLGAAERQIQLKPLEIGDTIPEELWDHPLQAVHHPDGKETITLGDYRNQKLIILDFWATWCGSCIAAMPDLDKIEKKYKSAKLAIIPVTYEEKDHVLAFTRNNRVWKDLNKKSVVGDRILSKAFPHRLLPHYIWIDSMGKVIHATGGKDVTEKNIAKILNNESIDVEVKKDHIDWDENIPILLDNPHNQSFFRSTLLEADKGYPSRQNLIYNKKEDKLRVYVLNRPIHALYEMAYRFPAVYHPSRIVVDRTDIRDIDQQLYCYEAEIAGNDTAKLFLHMQKDLDIQFDIASNMIEEEKWCWILQNRQDKKILKTSNAEPFHNLGDENRGKTVLKGQYIYLLASILSKSYNDLPFRNETGIRYRIDLELPVDLNNTERLNVELRQYGLRLIKEKRKIDVLYLTGY